MWALSDTVKYRLASTLGIYCNWKSVATGNTSFEYSKSRIAAGCADYSGTWNVCVCLEDMKEFTDVQTRKSLRDLEAS